MRKSIILLLIIITASFLFADEPSADENGISSHITRTEIKLGQAINLTTELEGLEEAKVLWQDAEPSTIDADILKRKDSYSEGRLLLEVEFSFFIPGSYEDFYITIPIVTKEGELLYLETKRYDINVLNPLTPEEEEKIKGLEIGAEYELKAEKPQAKIKYMFSGYLFLIGGVILFIFVSMLLFFTLYKKFLKMKTESETDFVDTLSPYERFVYLLGQVEFDITRDREYIEEQLSHLTEALKKLIYDEFEFNAPFETTKELFSHLRQISFDNDIVVDINSLFNEIDMIKFAKADFSRDQLNHFLASIRELGSRINSYYQEIKSAEEESAPVNDLNNEVSS